MPFLESLRGLPEGKFELDKDPYVIGRNNACDLVLQTLIVSREHARIEKEGDSYWLRDCESRHGTFLNGQRLRRRQRLKHGDEISICGKVLGFRDRAAAPEPLRIAAGPEDPLIMTTLDAHVDPGATVAEPGAKLRAVIDILRCLQTSPTVEELLSRVLESLFRIFPQASRAAALTIGEGDELVPVVARSRAGLVDAEVQVSQTIVQQAIGNCQAILSADAFEDDQFQGSHSIADLGIHSVMCVPVLDQSRRPLGLIQVHAEEQGRRFTEDDLDILVNVASSTALALDNLRLHDIRVAQEKLHRELELARDIQHKFLPPSAPEIPGYRFAAHYEAAQSVGGDYYGFTALPDGRLGVTVGDVSGKGMAAAMLMARLSSDVRFSLLTEPDAGAALQAIDRSLQHSAIHDKFVTLILLIVDPTRHVVTIGNAGHIPPLLRHPSGEVEELGEGIGGWPLLVSPTADYDYKSAEVRLEPGDCIVAVSDGIIEAMNRSRELYGIERLRDAVSAGPGTPSELATSVIDNVGEFVADTDQNDDITLVCFGRDPGGS